MSEIPDRELVDRVLRGSKEEYGLLVDRYERLVRHLALSLLRDHDLAEDVSQEAFLAAYLALDRLRNPGTYGGWIARITRNLCHNQLRKRKITIVSLDDLMEVGREPAAADPRVSNNTELLGAIRRCVQDLSQTDREIVQLCCDESCPRQRVADFLGLSLSAVLSRLHRARKVILQRLEKEGFV